MRAGNLFHWVECDNDGVTIHNVEDVKIFSGNKENSYRILYSDILGVEFYSTGVVPPVVAVAFDIRGKNCPMEYSKIDENPYSFKLYGDFAEKASEDLQIIVNYLKRKLSSVANSTPSNDSGSDVVNQLMNAKQLLDSGLISIEEFNDIKKNAMSKAQNTIKSGFDDCFLEVKDFELTYKGEKWNFIEKFNWKPAYYTFISGDRVRTSRGIFVGASMEDVKKAYGDTPYFVNKYLCLGDWIYRNGVKANSNDISVLKKCSSMLQYRLNEIKAGDKNIAMNFYFDANKKLILIGYKTQTLFSKE